VQFDWQDGLQSSIRTYDRYPAVRFRTKYLKGSKDCGVVFPRFTSFPNKLNHFSFEDKTFAPPTFGLADTSTPWLFFDDSANSMIFSPASNFMVAKMTGDGKSSIGAGLNTRLESVPPGLEQDSLMVFSRRFMALGFVG